MDLKKIIVESSTPTNYDILASILDFSRTRALIRKSGDLKDFYGEIIETEHYSDFRELAYTFTPKNNEALRSIFVYGPENFDDGIIRVKTYGNRSIDHVLKLAEEHGSLTIEFDTQYATNRMPRTTDITYVNSPKEQLIRTLDTTPNPRCGSGIMSGRHPYAFATDTFNFLRTEHGVVCVRAYIGSCKRAIETLNVKTKEQISKFRHFYAIADLKYLKAIS